jgi:hypothetical protein
MAKVQLHPLLEELRGKIDGLVFRLSHNGKTSVYPSPDMSYVKWSPAQVEHRARMAEASAYAVAATADPQLRAYYVEMSIERKGNKRPYDWALSDYYNGNNLLGDRFRWDREWWEATRPLRKRKKGKR